MKQSTKLRRRLIRAVKAREMARQAYRQGGTKRDVGALILRLSNVCSELDWRYRVALGKE